MKRIGVFVYAVSAYLFAMAGQIVFILYISPWDLMPWYIDRDMAPMTWETVGIDVGLVLLFGIQHTLMARPFFKKRLFGRLPESIERSTYVLLSGVMLWLIVLFFQPLEGYVWEFHYGIWNILLTVLFVAGWLLSTVATFIINHFELFGLQQGWYYLRGKSPKDIPFQIKLFYKLVRHPIQMGILVGLWAVPAMSYGHFCLSMGLSLYILIGIYFEEKDLERVFGERYAAYKQKVSRLIPFVY